MERVRGIPCVLCQLLGQYQLSPTIAHHMTLGRAKGTKHDDFLTIALCDEDCHVGHQGVHGDKTLLRIAKVDEYDLLALTLRALG